MNVLLDEHLDWRLKKLLTGHRVQHVEDVGWKGRVYSASE